MSIYSPSDDSYLLQEVLIEFLEGQNTDSKILDMGSGSGILAKTCIDEGFNDVTAADINPEVILHLKKSKISCIKSDLFSKVKEKFDLIIFNPPYLPEDSREPQESRLQTTGGKKGYEIILRFLNESISHLKKDGKLLLLFSSLSIPGKIVTHARKIGFKLKKVKEKRLPFENLFVYKLSQY